MRPLTTRLLFSAVLMAGAIGLASAQPLPLPEPEEAPAPPPAEAAVPKIEAPPPPPAATPPAAVTPATPPEEEEEAPKVPAPPPVAAKPSPPARRPLYTAAVVQVLDKVTAESLRFEAPVHKLIRFKGLIFLVNTCQGATPDQPQAAAHIEIDSQPQALPGRPQNPVKVVYRGWMYADTPGPHPFEHPVYDAWLIACKTASAGA